MKISTPNLIAGAILSLAAATTARPPPPSDQIHLSANKHHDDPPAPPLPPLKNITQTLFNEFEELARIVDISYCVGNSGIGAPFSCLSRCSDFPSFELIQSWNTGPFLTDSTGYIALSHEPAPKRIILAFRGTYSITNTIIDLSTTQQTYVPYPAPPSSSSSSSSRCENCTVHTGFYSSWKDAESVIGTVLSSTVEKYAPLGYKLEILGHSLGGAVAALAGLDAAARGWNPRITTFGEPRVGNVEFSKFVSVHFDRETFRRITHTSDPVPHLPFDRWGFAPHEFEYFITKKSLEPTVEDVVECTGGARDPRCSESVSVNGFQLFWSHRDYFHRLGLCLPSDPFGFWNGRAGQEPDGEEVLRDTL